MRINVDPDTDISGFGYANPGRYKFRISAVGEPITGPSGNDYLKWQIEFADPNVESADKKPDGSSKKVGNIFENTTLKKGENAQFRLRQLIEACGATWGDFDTEELIGREFEAEIDIKEYQGAFSNEIKKYIPAVV